MMRRESADSAIVTQAGRVVGILTDKELRDGLVAEGAPASTPVARIMSEHVLKLREDAPVFDALMAMVRERAYHVVVTRGEGSGAPTLGVVSDGAISRAQGNSRSSCSSAWNGREWWTSWPASARRSRASCSCSTGRA